MQIQRASEHDATVSLRVAYNTEDLRTSWRNSAIAHKPFLFSHLHDSSKSLVRSHSSSSPHSHWK
jgi:hypothetical protein